MTRFVQVAVLVVLALSVCATYAAGAHRASLRLTSDEIDGIQTRLDRVPLSTQDPVFRGRRDYLTDEMVAKSGAEYYAAVEYVAASGGRVRLHVGAAAHTDAWLHEPTVCLPRQGWRVRRERLVPIWPGLEGVADGTRIRRLELGIGDQRMLVYYWFQYGTRILTSKAERRRVRFHDLLAGTGDVPAQIVILYAPIDGPEEAVSARVEALVRAIWPTLFHVLAPGDSET